MQPQRLTQLLLVTALVGGATFWSACKTLPPKKGPYIVTADPKSPEAAEAKVVVLNYDLSTRLAVDQPPRARRNDRGQLEVQAGLRNSTDTDTLQLQVQTLYFDDAGHVLYLEPGSPVPWTPVTISPNQTYYYQARSLREDAIRFAIRVRYAKGTK